MSQNRPPKPGDIQTYVALRQSGTHPERARAELDLRPGQARRLERVFRARAARGEAQLFALRQISDNLTAQTRRLEGLGTKVDDVRERLARLEAQEAGVLVEAVRRELKSALARIDALEAQRDRVAGAAAFWTWLGRHAPWMAAALAAFGAGLVSREGGR